MYLRCQVFLSVFAASLILSIQNTEAASSPNSMKCQRTNSKAYRYCTKSCSTDGDCKSINSKCLCDGDCGLSCVKNNLRCDAPPSPKNSRKILSNSTYFGSVVTYSCSKPYKLRGSATRTCRAIRKWDGKKAECSLPCGTPPWVLNAQARYHSTNFGAIVTYVCYQGYTLYGASQKTCQSNGTWDRVGTICVRTCTLPEIPFSTYIAKPTNYNRTFLTGEIITLACKKGFKEQPGGNPIRVCINGRWTQFPLKCKENPDRRCVQLLRGLLKYVPRNTMIAINIRLSKARYRCREGFELVGKERTCKEGRWVEKEEPKCIEKRDRCVQLLRGLLKNVPRNTIIDISIRHSIAMYQCRHGFELVGKEFRMCKKGRWVEEEEPKCLDESDELRLNGTDVCNYEIEKRRERRAINLNDIGGLDLVFVLDSSDSVKKDGFQLSLEFAKELVRTIGTSKRANGTRIALVTFSTEAKVEFNLRDAKVDTLEKAIDAIGNVAYVGGASASALALKKVRKVVVPFARTDSKRLMLFITDGKSNINCSPRKEAIFLIEKEGFEIYATGVGKKVNVRELMAIASGDNEDIHVILVRRNGNLQKAIKKAVEFRIVNECGVTLTALSGEVTLPNYPGSYQSHRDCTWKIVAAAGNHLQLTFKEIDIGEETNCSLDYVEVFSVSDKQSDSLGRFCGRQLPRPLRSRSHKMEVKFHSDNKVSSKGFRAKYKAVCGSELNASDNKRQFYSHPNYGDDNYKQNSHCLWLLTARSGHVIRLRFKEFDVENEEKCLYDYVIIRDGNKNNSSLLGRVCGSASQLSSQEFVSTGNRMWIEFRTDLTNNKKGFIAEYSRLRRKDRRSS